MAKNAAFRQAHGLPRYLSSRRHAQGSPRLRRDPSVAGTDGNDSRCERTPLPPPGSSPVFLRPRRPPRRGTGFVRIFAAARATGSAWPAVLHPEVCPVGGRRTAPGLFHAGGRGDQSGGLGRQPAGSGLHLDGFQPGRWRAGRRRDDVAPDALRQHLRARDDELPLGTVRQRVYGERPGLSFRHSVRGDGWPRAQGTKGFGGDHVHARGRDERARGPQKRDLLLSPVRLFSTRFHAEKETDAGARAKAEGDLCPNVSRGAV